MPIPTYYGDEICYVNGLKYAKDVSRDVVRYRLASSASGPGTSAASVRSTRLKDARGQLPLRDPALARAVSPGALLDLGCSGGLLASAHGLSVTAFSASMSRSCPRRASASTDSSERTSIKVFRGEVLERGPFDIVLAGDVLEHVRSRAWCSRGARSSPREAC